MATTTRKAKKPYRVQVTADDIAKGIAGDCHQCAVALALTRATGDAEPMIFSSDWTLRIQVWSRIITAPCEVREFVHTFDDQPRDAEGRVDPSSKYFVPQEPFEFELPPLTDPEWEEQCYGCEELFSPRKLDDEGYCKECRESNA